MAIKGAKALSKDLKRISKGLTTDRLLLKIGLSARKGILVRTDRGKDYRGKDFTPYEDVTKVLRKRRGRQTSRVDLQFERHMLNNIQVKSEKAKNSVRLFFSRRTERDKAFKHNEVGVGRKQTKREFFALGKRLEDGIFKQYEKEIDRLIK
jgi:hypothetical protein